MALDDQGIVITRTGDVRALQLYTTGGIVSDLAARSNASISMEQLADERGQARIPLSDIRDVTMRRRKASKMQLKNSVGGLQLRIHRYPGAGDGGAGEGSNREVGGHTQTRLK